MPVAVLQPVLAPAPAPAPPPAQNLLDIDALQVEFRTAHGAVDGAVRVVDGVSLSVRAGEIAALVGESGCGKSVTALAVMGLLARPAARVAGGRIRFGGRDLLQLTEAQMRKLRGREIAMVFQEPMTSLNPVLTIGMQVMEPCLQHLGMGTAAARARAVELLGTVGIPDGARRLGQYPHQLSGGMRQRVMIAMALACRPRLLIADEPTTALDVTVQAEILALLQRLAREQGIGILIVTHNLGVVARYADAVHVMYAGRVQEQGRATDVFARPSHPYTVGLLRSVPRLDQPRRFRLATIDGAPPDLGHPPAGCRFAPRCGMAIARCGTAPEPTELGAGHRAACHRATELAEMGADAVFPEQRPGLPAVRRRAALGEPLLRVAGLRKHFPVPGRDATGGPLVVRAVEDVSFQIHRGETVGLVGESGCGKTTVGRMIVQLTDPTAGEIMRDGLPLRAPGRSWRDDSRATSRIQMVFQDPGGSLNPRLTIGRTLSETSRARHRLTRPHTRQRVAELLDQVGLPAEMAARYPHQLSGGQRQRVGIARALSLEPELIVCDEPVSALDVSIQGQIVNLLRALQEQLNLALLFIAHDLAVVRHISDRVVVMYFGRVVETGDSDSLYAAPLHPYTQALLDAVPVPDPAIEARRRPVVLRGEPPSPLDPPAGCAFHTRCPRAGPECLHAPPPLRAVSPTRAVACFRAA